MRPLQCAAADPSKTSKGCIYKCCLSDGTEVLILEKRTHNKEVVVYSIDPSPTALLVHNFFIFNGKREWVKWETIRFRTMSTGRNRIPFKEGTNKKRKKRMRRWRGEREAYRTLSSIHLFELRPSFFLTFSWCSSSNVTPDWFFGGVGLMLVQYRTYFVGSASTTACVFPSIRTTLKQAITKRIGREGNSY